MKRHIVLISTLIMTMILSAPAAETSKMQNQPIVPKEKTMLWNGRDLTGWKPFTNDKNADPP